MSRLTENARKCLKDAGWSDGRSIDTNALEQANRESGFFVSEKAISFLREFGNLRLAFPHYRAPARDDWCHFDACVAAGNAIPEAIREYENAIGQQLSVIGEARSDHMTLCMDDIGRVYGGFEDILVKFGDSGIEAINSLVEGNDCQPIDTLTPKSRPAQNRIELSQAARRALVNSSWVGGDAVAGFKDASDAFLARFGGVSFKCQIRDSGSDVCQIDRIYLPIDYVRECSSLLHDEISPVGRLAESGMVLMMGRDGRVYGGMTETPEILWLIGMSGTDAINNLVAGSVAQRVI